MITPSLARRIMGGAAAGAGTALALNEILKRLKKRKK
jgi:hypothetical protein